MEPWTIIINYLYKLHIPPVHVHTRRTIFRIGLAATLTRGNWNKLWNASSTRSSISITYWAEICGNVLNIPLVSLSSVNTLKFQLEIVERRFWKGNHIWLKPRNLRKLYLNKMTTDRCLETVLRIEERLVVVRKLVDGLVLPLDATHSRELVLGTALARLLVLAQTRSVLLRRRTARKHARRLRSLHHCNHQQLVIRRRQPMKDGRTSRGTRKNLGTNPLVWSRK